MIAPIWPDGKPLGVVAQREGLRLVVAGTEETFLQPIMAGSQLIDLVKTL